MGPAAKVPQQSKIYPDGVEWRNVYGAIRNKWAKGSSIRELTKLTSEQFFQGTKFVPQKRVVVRGQRKLELDHLIFRALGTPTTTSTILRIRERTRGWSQCCALPCCRTFKTVQSWKTTSLWEQSTAGGKIPDMNSHSTIDSNRPDRSGPLRQLTNHRFDRTLYRNLQRRFSGITSVLSHDP